MELQSGISASHLCSPAPNSARSPHLKALNEEELLPGFRNRWEMVTEADGTTYRFPNLPSRAMRAIYDGPAVYRWVPFREVYGDLGRVYFGEAQSLVDRINNYRTGSESQQTSFRLRKLFEGYVVDGISVCLERLRFDHISLGSLVFTEDHLRDKLFRRFVEHMMASYYRKLGWDLINT